jgi:hypothetical protein
MNSKLTRQYHGHTIVSSPAPDDVGDGWIHDLSKDGRDLGTFPTLALAIAEARRLNSGGELPVVVDSPLPVDGVTIDEAGNERPIELEKKPKRKSK